MTRASTGPRRDIAEIKLSYPLLEVVERVGVRLKRSGSHRWQGLCPLHEDRHPSLFVDVERQRFVCFGCKARGDVIDSVRLHEHLDTVSEACAWLTGTPAAPPASARRGPAAPNVEPQRRWDRLTLEQQLVPNAAGALYRDALWRNRRVRAYLTEERGLPEWVVRACGLGYADGRSLEAHLRKHGGLRIAEELGLLRRPELCPLRRWPTRPTPAHRDVCGGRNPLSKAGSVCRAATLLWVASTGANHQDAVTTTHLARNEPEIVANSHGRQGRAP